MKSNRTYESGSQNSTMESFYGFDSNKENFDNTFKNLSSERFYGVKVLNESVNGSENRKDMIESIERRFKLELEKEKEFSSLLINKLNQEVDFLKIENEHLKDTNEKLKNELNNHQNETNSQKSSINPSISINQTAQLKNMLENLEKEHENCIKIKKDLVNKLETQEIRNKILLEENTQLQTELKECKKVSESLKSISNQNETYRREIECLKKEIISLKSLNSLKQLEFNKQLQELQKSLENLSIKTEIAEKKETNEREEIIRNYSSHFDKQLNEEKPLEEKLIIEKLYKKNLHHFSQSKYNYHKDFY